MGVRLRKKAKGSDPKLFEAPASNYQFAYPAIIHHSVHGGL